MSPHAKKRAVTITITTAAIGTAFLGALAWGMPSARSVRAAIANVETRSHADSAYVRRDSFALYQQGDAAIHQRDSLGHANEVREIRHVIDSTAIDLKVCIRHPGDCR